jgi:prepilin-type N-terminal cleavage/methylation domain-containing protein/prepilin-type processing-associated H-X9-DG protein
MKKLQINLGFTLIELLVVISIIGMLAGLLLPAIQSARETGRGAVCISNQRQIAYQLVAAASNAGGFPALMRGNAATNHSYSWVTQLLPVIEEQGLYDLIKETGAGTTYGTAVTEYTIPVLKCKSSDVSSTGEGISYVINGGVLDTSSLVSASDPIGVNDVKYSAAVTRSRTAAGSNITTAKIEDFKSTTKTVIISENLNAGSWSYGLNSPSTGTLDDGIESQLAFTYGADSSGDPTEVLGINQNNVTGASPALSTARPSSKHPGSVNAGFADGGARKINENIDYRVYRSLCQPSVTNINAADLGW